MRKRNSFFNPVEKKKTEPIDSIMQKTVAIVQKITEIHDAETSNAKKILDEHSSEYDGFYSLGWNPVLKSSLPVDILKEGFIGFTWKAQQEAISGKFPMSSLHYAQTQEKSSCFSLEGDILYGKYSGIYIWDCTLKAVIPSIFGCTHPQVQLKIRYDYSPWNTQEQLRETTSTLILPMVHLGTLLINQHKYDIIELPPGQAKIFIVPENCHGIALHMENHQQVEGIPQDLYVMQASYSCNWRKLY